jgi:tetratricopeptide (TPR) repeat protein
MTLGFVVSLGVAAVFCPAGEQRAGTQAPSGESGPAKSADGQGESNPTMPALEEAYQFEAHDKLEEALAALPGDKVQGDVKKHRDSLLKILVSKRAADAYEALGRPERARQTFEEKRPKERELDPIRDAPLFGVLARLRDNYERNAAVPAVKLAREVATANATPSAASAPLPDDLVQQALIGAIESDRDDADSKSVLTEQGAFAQLQGALVEIVSALATALRYLFFFAVALGLFILLLRFPEWRLARPEVVLDLKDLVSSAGGQVGSQPLGGPDRALTHDFLLAIQSLARDSDGLGEVVLSRDTDSQSFADLRVIDDDLVKELEQSITGSEPVKLGPVSFTPRELFQLLRRAFERPPALSLTGSLSRPPSDGAAGVGDGRVSLSVVGLVRGRALQGRSPFPDLPEWPPSPRRWDASHSGPGARDRVVREVAANFVFHTIKTNVTHDWPSFRDYHEAMYLNRLEDPVVQSPPGDSSSPAGKAPDPARDRMIQAAALLQSSVRHDPTNWLAAFFFGNVLRRLGRNAAAARVFKGLSGRIRQARLLQGTASDGADEPLWRLRAFLERKDYSDFEAVVAYNEAVSLSKTNDRVKNLEAIDTLGRLVKASQRSEPFAPTLRAVFNLSGDSVADVETPELSEPEPAGDSRLAMFSLSALASALVVEYEALRYGRGEPQKAKMKAGTADEKPGKAQEHANGGGESATKGESTARRVAPEDVEAAEVAHNAAEMGQSDADEVRSTANKAEKAAEGARKKSAKLTDRHQKRRKTVFDAIVAIDRELDTYDNNSSIDRATYNIARGLARNALGRAYYIARLYDSAYEALTDATELLPDFAEAYVNLATVCLVDRGGRPAWVIEAQGHLATALRLNSASSKANYLMGKLCVRLGLDRLGEAEKYFLAAGRDVWADLELARLYADLLEPPDLKKGLRRLQSSLSLYPTPDYRPIAFLEYVARLAPSDLADERFKQSLCATVRRIRPERFNSEALRKRAERLLPKATQLLGCTRRPTTEGVGDKGSASTPKGQTKRIPAVPKATPPKIA